jgi:hypothetical protein
LYIKNKILVISISILLVSNLNKMFSGENLKKTVGTLVIVMVALAVHQRFIAPILAPKKTA